MRFPVTKAVTIFIKKGTMRRVRERVGISSMTAWK